MANFGEFMARMGYNSVMNSVLSDTDVPIIGEGATEEQAVEPAENPLARQLTYTFAAGEVDAAVGERLSQMSKKARINGFRPGHVPMRVMRQRWGGHCLGEILTEKANARFTKEASEMKERPAASPQIAPSSVADGGDYKVECHYEAMPEVKAPDFEKQEIRRPTLTVGESEIDEMIERLRRDAGHYAEVPRAAESTDRVKVDFEVMRDGQKAESTEGHHWFLDSPAMSSEVSNEIIGSSAGDSREITIRHPDDHPDEQLRGVEILLKVKVREVSELHLPEMNEGFFARFGAKTEEDFRKMVGERLTDEVSRRLRQTMHSRAMNALITATPPFPLPRALVQMEASSMFRRMQEEARSHGMPSVSSEMAHHTYSEAARRVALGLIIARWHEDTKTKVSDDEINTRIDEVSSGYEDPKGFAARARGDERMRQAVRLEILEQKAAEWVCESAQTLDEPVTLSQLLGRAA